jgi:hypothetical protein
MNVPVNRLEKYWSRMAKEPTTKTKDAEKLDRLANAIISQKNADEILRKAQKDREWIVDRWREKVDSNPRAMRAFLENGAGTESNPMRFFAKEFGIQNPKDLYKSKFSETWTPSPESPPETPVDLDAELAKKLLDSLITRGRSKYVRKLLEAANEID